MESSHASKTNLVTEKKAPLSSQPKVPLKQYLELNKIRGASNYHISATAEHTTEVTRKLVFSFYKILIQYIF